ncbi:MAG: zinc ribbon domain-containing protein [Chloroflexi bacterium]|nr:MAG: zinc ribbon domain-containing protein [Chloroflexota bacterium]
MPIYDYVCEACGHRLEVMHGVDAPGPASCPACGARPMRKAFALPAVVFKGSGWAKKDRRSASRRKAEKAETGAETSDGAKAATGSGDGGKDDGGKDDAGSASTAKHESGSTTSTPAPAGD